METFGYSSEVWSAAKAEARAVLIDRARHQDTIAYSELVPKITSIDLQAKDPRLDELLSQLSREESQAGRGMLSVIVVHKHGDQRPGPGFFALAETMGLDATDLERLWIKQLTLVYEAWSHA